MEEWNAGIVERCDVGRYGMLEKWNDMIIVCVNVRINELLFFYCSIIAC